MILISLLFAFTFLSYAQNNLTIPYTSKMRNGKFVNIDEKQFKFSDLLKWMSNRNRNKWPKWIETNYAPPPIERTDKNELCVTFINHSTCLIQVDSLNILTDPIWSTRCGPVSFAGPKRVQNPGIRFNDLPPIDIVLISHNHYDHMDIPTLKRLRDKFSPLFIVSLKNKNYLNQKGFKNIEELDWWDSINLTNGYKIYFVPAQHFSNRSMFDRNKTLWGGFVIESSMGNIYFAGDTGFGSFFEDIKAKFSDITFAILPIGAYEPRWFMKHLHLNPDDAVDAFKILKPLKCIGVHFATFQLSDEGINQPETDLKNALIKNQIDKNNFIVPEFGQTILIKN